VTPAEIKRRMLAAREEAVTAGGRTFTVRRLAEYPLLRIKQQNAGDTNAFLVALMRDSVVGWDMREQDLVPGGSDDAAPFDTDVFMTWVEDEPAVLSELAEAVFGVISRHRDKKEAAAKN